MFAYLDDVYYKFYFDGVVVKTMVDEESCQGCNQAHSCREMYGKLGNSKGPSVALGAVIAFLVPIVVFVISLTAVERIAGRFTARATAQTAIGLAVALAVTLLWVLAARVIIRTLSGNGNSN